MAHIIENRVLEASTTAGAGPLTLAGAVQGYRAFSAVCAVSDTVPYYIEAVDADGRPTGDYEFGLGTYSAANQLSRTTVRGSSNGGLAVAFAAGTKLVGLGVMAPNSPETRAEWRAALGLTAVGSAVATAASQAAAQAAIGVTPRDTGEVVGFLRSTAPAGFVILNGQTIGNAASGATLRANADTLDLFTLLWEQFSQAILPIQTSAGGASVRGASAAADYAANKRLPVHDFRGEFARGWDGGRGVDAGRVLGASQTDAFQSHKHQGLRTSYLNSGVPAGGNDTMSSSGTVDGNPVESNGGVPRTGTETRPRNVAILYCVKL
jgi:hypothetical protein